MISLMSGGARNGRRWHGSSGDVNGRSDVRNGVKSNGSS